MRCPPPEETKNPNRNIPIGLIGSLAVCTIFYLFVGYGAVGAMGAQPLFDAAGNRSAGQQGVRRGLRRRGRRSRAAGVQPRPLAHVLRARPPADGQRHRHRRRAGPAHRHPDDDLRPDPHLLHDVARRPAAGPLSKIHPKFSTAHHHHHHRHRGVAVLGDVPGGVLADISNSGTLFAFIMVSIGVLVLRVRQPNRPRPFRTPFAWPVCILAIAGCILLFVNLSVYTIALFFGWAPSAWSCTSCMATARLHDPGNEPAGRSRRQAAADRCSTKARSLTTGRSRHGRPACRVFVSANAEWAPVRWSARIAEPPPDDMLELLATAIHSRSTAMPGARLVRSLGPWGLTAWHRRGDRRRHLRHHRPGRRQPRRPGHRAVLRAGGHLLRLLRAGLCRIRLDGAGLRQRLHYAYATFGELSAWFIGWMLVLEYGVSGSAVAVSWTGYFLSLLDQFDIHLPAALVSAPLDGPAAPDRRVANLPAAASCCC
jgi:hypothetical protein